MVKIHIFRVNQNSIRYLAQLRTYEERKIIQKGRPQYSATGMIYSIK